MNDVSIVYPKDFGPHQYISENVKQRFLKLKEAFPRGGGRKPFSGRVVVEKSFSRYYYAANVRGRGLFWTVTPSDGSRGFVLTPSCNLIVLVTPCL